MSPNLKKHLLSTLSELAAKGLSKRERIIGTPQAANIGLTGGARVLNLCANNYLGLADHPRIVSAAHAALDRWGYGVASVRFICGTLEIHKELESSLTTYLGTEDTLLYGSCYDANAGVFEVVLGEEDAVISDELNHASIIDGIKLSKAARHRYKNADMADLEAKLRDCAKARFKIIATDGVFSMDGTLAPLREICDLADKHNALVMVDDSHGVGLMGPSGRGTHEHCGVVGRIDILTGTLGKALGGATGGYVSGRKEIVDLLRQLSRPYLFSNALPPVVAATSVAVLDFISRSPKIREKLHQNTKFFREGLASTGLIIKSGVHPIVPVMLGDALRAQQFAARMLEKGIYVVGFFHPVVPQGTARIRTQVSAAHSEDDLKGAIQAFAQVRKELAC